MGPADPSSLGMSPISLGTLTPEERCQRKRDSVFPQCRRAVPWIPGCWWTQERAAVLCPSPPRSVHLRCPRGRHLEGSSWPAVGTVLGFWGNRRLTRLRACSLSAAGSPGCPSRQAAACALGPRLARSCPPPRPLPRPAQRPRPPRWRSRASSRDCRPPQRAGGPGLAPPRTGGGGLGRGCVVVRGTQGGRGPRPLRQCGRSALSACSGSGDVLRKILSKPPRNRKRVQTSAMGHLQ